MQSLLKSLQQRFNASVCFADGGRADQVYACIEASEIGAIAHFLSAVHSARLALLFAEHQPDLECPFSLCYVFERPGDSAYLLLRASLPPERSAFPSLAAEFPAVNWQEREIQDWFGLKALGHPNPRRVALHDNWPEVHPLRKDFPLEKVLPPFEGEQHEYRPALGEGVFQIPVGPVHAGIIEPGHFNFAVAGEPILYLQLRMFYTHKGVEKLFEHLPVHHAVFLAESISGDSAFSHGTAFCQAVEQAGEIEVPPRARFMRVVLLELERICNHIADIGAVAADVGFVVANAHAGALREAVVTLSEELTGNRLLRGMVTVGGLRRDWSSIQITALRETVEALQSGFHELLALIQSSDSTRDRLERTGRLSPDKASALGVVGVAGRASGIDLDVRRDHPYAAYSDLPFHVPVYQEGDVLRRVQVRMDEVQESFGIIRRALSLLPQGPFCAKHSQIPPDRCALSAVEGWRGEILHWIRTGRDGRLERCKIKDPSLNNWPALVEAVQGNIVPDFPVINKSFNLSYSGTDR